MVLDKCIEAAKANRRTIVLPEGEDARVAEAASEIVETGIADVCMIGGAAAGCETLDPATDPRLPALAALIAERRGRLKPSTAERLLLKPAYFAGALVAAGHAHGMVAGAATPTRRIIEAASMTVGLAEGVETPSSFFLMATELPILFSDCALNVAPDAGQLADIAIASAASAQDLLGSARVAMLSFSTLGSSAGVEVDRVRRALEIARARMPALNIDGEFQADTALNASIAVRKGATGNVAGRANVLVFPSLEAGNIAYKLVQEMAGIQAIGPFLQGFRRPVCDLSRGACVDDIIAAVAVTAALDQNAGETKGA